MKKFFSLIFAGALLAGLVSSVSAQGGGAGPKGGAPGVQGGPGGPGGPGGRRPGGRMAELMGKIQPPLTADQKKKIEAINKDFRAQMQKLMGGTPGQPPKPGQNGGAGRPNFDRSKFEPLMKKRNEAILRVLNDKQDASYKKLMEEMMKRRRQGGQGGRPGGPPPPGGNKGGTKPPL